ncbi:hypothetical protein OKW30_001876 [Paraburkholderia sp. Clong3]|nr:hypothetical protein [Paraburkholderia sp. CI2]
MPDSTTSKTIKMSIVLDSSGRIVGASKPKDYRPAKGEQPEVTAGQAADRGQSIAEIEVSPELADLNASDLLLRLSEEASVRALVADLPTAGAAPTAGVAIASATPDATAASRAGSQDVSAGTITAGSA